jgi:hypothetical protein
VVVDAYMLSMYFKLGRSDSSGGSPTRPAGFGMVGPLPKEPETP